MTLKTKLQLFSAAVIVSAGAAIVVLTNRTVHDALLRELSAGQVARAREAAGPLATGARARRERVLLPLLQGLQARTGAAYAYVTDPAGVVLAHTNVVEVGKLYRDAVTVAALDRDEPGYAPARAGDRAVLDVAVPLREPEEDFLLAGGGARPPLAAVLHLGAPLEPAIASEARIARAILWIMLGVALVAMAVVTWFNTRVLAPVAQLAAGTERLARGELGVRIPETARDELGALARAFNRMSASLLEESAHRRELQEQLVKASRMEAMGLVAAKVAHDFNNMLTVILGFGRIADRKLPEGHEARGALAEVLRAGERATAISKNLTAFSLGQLLQPVVLDLNAWVKDSSGILARLAGEGVTLTLELGAEAPWVRADPGQLTQVATNLVANARDAMDGKGAIRVGTSNVVLDAEFVRRHPAAAPGAYVELWVADAGHGMDEATLARMFEPFFTTKALGKGTGLGLASVHGIVRQSGGYVWAESAVGRGTTFRISLPRSERGPALSLSKGAASSTAARAGAAGDAVLLVDDEDAVRGVAHAALVAGGYRVLEARNGVEALAVSDAHPDRIAVLVTDAVMPQVSGFELARRLLSRRPGLRVVVMTGFTNEAVVPAEAASLGHEFLAKPFTDEEMQRAVRKALDGR